MSQDLYALRGERVEGLYARLMHMDKSPQIDPVTGKVRDIRVSSLELSANWVGPISKTAKMTLEIDQDIDWYKTLFYIVYRTRKPGGDVVEMPFGYYFPSTPVTVLMENSPTWSVDLYDLTLALAEDQVGETYVAPAGALVTDEVRRLVDSVGFPLDLDIMDSDVTLSRNVSWGAGTSKQEIATALLDRIDYHRITMAHSGRLFSRSREAQEGSPATAVFSDEPVESQVYAKYDSQFEEKKDLFKVPNRWVARAMSDGPLPGMVAVVENTDPESPTSYQARGRWVSRTTDETDVDTYGQLLGVAKRNLANATSVTHTVTFSHSILPTEIRDQNEFHNSEYGIHVRGIVTSQKINMNLPTAVCTTSIRVRENL